MSPPAPARRSNTMLAVRYVLPGVICLSGIVILIVDRSLIGLEGFVLFIGAGLSILLLNVLYRIGVSGDAERDREEEARTYFDEHGRWPD
ncbi:MAG TPA: hypothetical protein VMY78_17800 [Solirubrobacteraceae bacterium]|nr:hypothetical protein [Solirubrobacteraceae bacterium]